MTKKAKITFYGHSSFLVTSETGKTIFIDPWLDGNPACPKKLEEVSALDYICLTHGHSDHVGSVLSLAKNTGAQIYAIYELINLLRNDGVPESQLQPLNKGGKAPLDGSKLAISLTNAEHSSSYVACDGSVHYAGEACGIVIHLESGRTIYHTGDTALFSDMELIGDIYTPEVAILPIGDRFTMGPEAAADAANLIQPEMVIPMHYETFEALSGKLEAFEDLVEASSSIRVSPLKPGESLDF